MQSLATMLMRNVYMLKRKLPHPEILKELEKEIKRNEYVNPHINT
jgi:hypothetical protein